jgi:hypothetical protein
MRPLRPLFLCLAISATIIAACGSPAASGAGGPTATSGAGEATATAPGEPTQPPPTTGGGGGGGANGSVTYQISGDYTASGELPFVTQVSSFSNGGWTATFANESAAELIQINTIAGTLVVAYGDATVAIAASPTTGCTVNVTKSDSTGLAGDFQCSGPIAAKSATGTQINVTFSGAFSGHP